MLKHNYLMYVKAEMKSQQNIEFKILTKENDNDKIPLFNTQKY